MENEPKTEESKAPAGKPTATMRHPFTEHIVEATQEELVGLMYRGYQQVPKKEPNQK